MAVFVKNIERPNRIVVRRLSRFGIATIHESIGKETGNLMNCLIKPLNSGMKLAGPAITVDCFPADNITVHAAMTLCASGDVLVVNGHSSPSAMFGAQMSKQAIHRGIAGIVVDGGVRDSEEIRRMNFPCFARFISAMGAAKNTPGSINIPIQCRGALVNPGDIIVGDDDGVVIVPRMRAGDVIELAVKREDKERKDRKLYAKGKMSTEINKFDEIIKERGVKEVDSLDQKH